MARKNHRVSARDRRRQFLKVAGHLFARQGYQGTTTRQIAERAHVNEALIFRHFRTKEALYWALLEDQCQPADTQRLLRERLREGSDDREIFASIAEDILRRNTRDTTRSRLLLFSALENHRLAGRFFRTHIADYYNALAEHIARRVRQGRFRPVDPLLAARGFLGMVVYHFLIQELFGGRRYQRFSLRKVSQTLSDIWLEGMVERKHCDTGTAATSNPR
ncbi:MAG: TetR/AcrR family transcriptional regulator [Terriglobales bacterium]